MPSNSEEDDLFTRLEMLQSMGGIDLLATALAEAQGEFPAIEKRKEGKVSGRSRASGRDYEYSYKYADISDVIASIRPVLAKHGLALLQQTVIVDNNMILYSRLLHKSGQWISSEYPVCAIANDHQAMGGALTYARRYAMTSMLGLSTEDDVDGKEAARPEARRSRRADAGVPQLINAIKAASSEEELKAIGRDIANKGRSLSTNDHTELRRLYLARLHELTPPIPAPFEASPIDALKPLSNPEMVVREWIIDFQSMHTLELLDAYFGDVCLPYIEQGLLDPPLTEMLEDAYGRRKAEL